LTVHSLRDRTVLVIPTRLGLGVVWLAAAWARGVRFDAALLAFAVGVFGLVFLAVNDPRRRLAHGELEPLELPEDAILASRLRQALTATIPSTVGVSVLAAVAVWPQPVLAALLGGVSAGLGIAALLALPRVDPSLYVDPRTHVFYRE
jgi:hypothetical protein